MHNQQADIARKRFAKQAHELTANEQHVIHHHLRGTAISRNPQAEFEQRSTLGQRVADRVASFGGSWTFILLFCFALVCWVALNSWLLARSGAAFDPFPYILLNLLLSMTAALQAPVIMMSQNRLAAKDRLDAAHDYEVNLRAELEIMALHEKMDTLREQQWRDLVRLQQEQIRLLGEILQQKNAR
ncbi:MAG: DUF1003 domain-containing protein [Blastocatellia bacterium]